MATSVREQLSPLGHLRLSERWVGESRVQCQHQEYLRCVWVCVCRHNIYSIMLFITLKLTRLSLYTRDEMSNYFHYQLICYFCMKSIYRTQKIAKNHKYPEPKVTSLNLLFCPNISQKPKHVQLSLTWSRKKISETPSGTESDVKAPFRVVFLLSQASHSAAVS